MATLSELEGRVLDRLEEDRSLPKFWNLQDEIRPMSGSIKGLSLLG